MWLSLKQQLFRKAGVGMCSFILPAFHSSSLGSPATLAPCQAAWIQGEADSSNQIPSSMQAVTSPRELLLLDIII